MAIRQLQEALDRIKTVQHRGIYGRRQSDSVRFVAARSIELAFDQAASRTARLAFDQAE